jgi:hypothetical protein
MAAITAPATPTPDPWAAAALLAGDTCGTEANAPPGAPAEAGGANDGAAGASAALSCASHDLHPGVRAFVQPPGGDAGGRGPQDPWAGHGAGAGVPLYQRQPGQVGQNVHAAPKAPAPFARLDQLSVTMRTFRPDTSPFPNEDVIAVQRSITKATAALHSGDYKTAAAEFQKLGFPLPLDGNVSYESKIASHLLGLPTRREDGGIIVSMTWGNGGNQALNDLNGYAANARMMSHFDQVPGVSNPPTEAQMMAYMKALPSGLYMHADRYADIVKYASEITEGTIAHYSGVPGAKDPTYGANPSPKYAERGPDGTMHEYATLAEAKRDGHPNAKPLAAHSPDEWSDIASIGKHGARYIGDCESKLYLQTRLLTQAGFTSLGSVDAQRTTGGTGHMLGVFKAPDGSVWVTSNEDFARVRGSGPKGEVTERDVDATVRKLTAEVWDLSPNDPTMSFASAATRNQTGANAATDTLRRATELRELERNEPLIDPTSAGGTRNP